MFKSFLLFSCIAISNFANCQKVKTVDFKSLNTEMADGSAIFVGLKVGDTLLITYQETGCFHFQSGEYRIYQSGDETFVEKSRNILSKENTLEKSNSTKKKIVFEKLTVLEKSNNEMRDRLSEGGGLTTNSFQYSIYKNNFLLVNRLHYNLTDELLMALGNLFKD